jgi:DNA-binding NarL/FixJ family response regulator
VIRVLLADDNEFVRTAIAELFHSTGDIAVVAECSDGNAVLGAVEQAAPDVVVLDLAMPGRTGLEAARDLLSADPGARILMLTGNPSPAAVREAQQIGVGGYVLKGEDPTELIGHVRAVAAGGQAWSPSLLTSGAGSSGNMPPNCAVSYYAESRHGTNVPADTVN